MITDHWFRMSDEIPADQCVYAGCGRPRSEHAEGVNDDMYMRKNHWFIGFRWCAVCGFRRRHSVHYLTKDHRKKTGRWI